MPCLPGNVPCFCYFVSRAYSIKCFVEDKSCFAGRNIGGRCRTRTCMPSFDDGGLANRCNTVMRTFRDYIIWRSVKESNLRAGFPTICFPSSANRPLWQHSRIATKIGAGYGNRTRLASLEWLRPARAGAQPLCQTRIIDVLLYGTLRSAPALVACTHGVPCASNAAHTALFPSIWKTTKQKPAACTQKS